jgi:hypothetical protein
VGLGSTVLSSAADRAAAADMRQAVVLTAQGNTSAANIALARAHKTSSTAAGKLKSILMPPTMVASPAPVQTAETPSLLTRVLNRVGVGTTRTVDSTLMVKQLDDRVVDTIPAQLTAQRTLGIVVGAGDRARVETLTWHAGSIPASQTVIDLVYATRPNAAALEPWLSNPATPSDAALALPHDYYFVIPLGLAECYHALGDWRKAETNYLAAAGYQYINANVEAPFVWLRLATLYVDWANATYRRGETGPALTIYQKVLDPGDTLPAASPLYSTAGLQPGVTLAREVIAAFGDLLAHPASAATRELDPLVAAVLLEAHQRIAQINAGLDFWGVWAPSVPIWTFEYLQQVAINYCQLAIGAERDVINFWDRADQASLTRAELSQRVSDSSEELNMASLQLEAAQKESEAYSQGAALAAQRADDAAQNRADYAALHGTAIQYQASSAQVSGGDDGNPAELNGLADQLLGGQAISGSRGTIAAATQLAASRLDQQYELASMDRTTAELDAAALQANAELAAANARVAVSQAGVALAALRQQEAQQTLGLFDDFTFTPQVWQRMGDSMFRLYRRYLDMAMRTARMMQRAYNFENDRALTLIKPSYAGDEIRGLLAADNLMADVQSFTDETLTSTRSKTQLMKQVISLSERHSYLFETQLRPTGAMTFETTFDDFEMKYPGTYGGRIRAVEVAVEGLVPVTGISGILTNGGISRYRLPSDSWTAASGVRYRIQSAETLVLSDYDRRSDLLDTNDNRKLGIFAGAGVASTWSLDLPRAVNDIDYNLITDVKLTITYDARFDPALVDRVKGLIAAEPGAHAAQMGIPLRWLYPDLFFRFQDTGMLTLTLAAADFPLSQQNPVVTSAGILVVPKRSGLALHLSTPGHASAASPTNADGLVSTTLPGSTLTGLTGGSALGDYVIQVKAAENPALVHSGKLDLSGIANLVLLLGYTYTPRA